MLVTQSDYNRWQSMYGTGKNDVNDPVAGENKSRVNEGQKFALEGGKDENVRSTLSGSVRQKTFLEEVFERTLNNRLGIDQGKMDEIKEEIEKTELAIEVLSKQKPQTENQQKELKVLEDKLEKLEEALNELVKQASERAIENDKHGQKTNHSIAQYQSVASFF